MRGFDVPMNVARPMTMPLLMPYRKLLRKQGIFVTSLPNMYSGCKDRKTSIMGNYGNIVQSLHSHVTKYRLCPSYPSFQSVSVRYSRRKRFFSFAETTKTQRVQYILSETNDITSQSNVNCCYGSTNCNEKTNVKIFNWITFYLFLSIKFLNKIKFSSERISFSSSCRCLRLPIPFSSLSNHCRAHSEPCQGIFHGAKRSARRLRAMQR